MDRYGLRHHQGNVIELLVLAEFKHASNDGLKQLIRIQTAATVQQLQQPCFSKLFATTPLRLMPQGVCCCWILVSAVPCCPEPGMHVNVNWRLAIDISLNR